MTDSLKTLFSPYKEAIVAVKDGEIAFFNCAAETLIPGIGTNRPDDIFPAQLLEYEAASFAGAAELGGRTCTVSVSELNGYRIFTLFPFDNAKTSDAAMLLLAVDKKMRERLAVVKMSASLLTAHLEKLGDERLNRYATMITHNCYCMERSIRNVCELGSHQNDGTTDSFDLVEVFGDLIDSTEHLVANRGIRFSFKARPGSMPVNGDRAELEKLLLNLLSNSIKYTPENGSINVQLLKMDDKIVLTVRDTGRGIPEHELFSVWNRYGTIGDSSDPLAGGGLGLSIVQQVARANGGSAVLERAPGAGTTVTVVMRLKKPDGNILRHPDVPYGGGMQTLLRELSDVLECDRYTGRYMD